MDSQSLSSTKACITNTNDLIIETNTIEKLIWYSALAGAKCCNRSYAISKLAKSLKWGNEKQNINSKMLNEIIIACMKYLIK